MRKIWVMVLGAIAMGATQPPPAPLAPSGKWVIDYQPNMCVLSRDFGMGQSKITFGFRPYPLTQGMEIAILSGARIHHRRSGKGRVTLLPSGKVFSADYVSYDVTKGPGHVTVVRLDDSTEADFLAANVITIDAGRERVSVAPGGSIAAFKAADTCDDDLLKTWKIDPNEQQLIAQPAIPQSIGSWVTSDDYPPEALRAGLGGTSTIVWTIGIDGRVSDCRTVVSSNVAFLDQAACKAISTKGRYKPALDKAGHPMVSHNTRRVVWVIP